VALALTVVGIGVTTATTASADTPAAATVTLPETVSADALPTWQVNGVVWSQAIVGNTVYVVGSFSKARPPGVAVGGAGEIDANNIFAFDVTTGNAVTSFSHSLNAQGLIVRAAPDGSRIYVGGDFTAVDGVARGHVAAFDTATGSLLTTFAPNTDGQVRAFAITSSTVYVGGNFRSAAGKPRTLFAAFSPTNGAITAWAPVGDGGYTWAMVMSPDNSRVIAAGSFTTLNGADAYGMGAIDAGTGANLPWAATTRIRTAGLNGAIASLSTDGTQVFGTGYAYGAGASFEGTFSADPNTGTINWVQDCLGDTYDSWPMNGVLYTVSHNHDCSVVGGFPDTSPRSRWQKAGAMPTFGTGTITRKDAYGWDFTGLSYPGVLHWFPDLEFGTYTADRQAAWSVTGNSNYLVLGGEFPIVNGVAQQGLVRFAKRSVAPNKMGPIYNATFNPNPISTDSGTVKVLFNSIWDRDDPTLSYDVFRNSGAKILTVTKDSTFWKMPSQTFTDTGLTPGSQVRYQIRARDASGNYQFSAWSSYITVSSATPSTYAGVVRGDGATHLWRLTEPTGTAAVDDIGDYHGAYTNMTLGTAGAIVGETGTGVTSTANSAKVTTRDISTAPQTFSVEAWVKTTSTRGGRIVGFGNNPTGTATSGYSDRALYLDTSGRPNFTVYSGAQRPVSSRVAINDGQWHHVVGTLDPTNGMQLFVDGLRVGRDQRYVSARDYDGYWRIGNDSVSGYSSAPSDAGLVGSFDEVAVYPSALTAAQVKAHYLASGRAQTWPAAPTDAYGQAVTADSPDLFWRLNTISSTLVDESGNGRTGNQTGSVTGGQTGPITGNTAANFQTNGLVVDKYSWNAPQAYTEEVWFKTTTTKGGKLIGFGNATSGLSSSYDRHVWMLDNGKVSFGANAGSQVVLTSTSAYNDGQWHYLVASQGSGGMRLWVDTVLVGSNSNSVSQDYTGSFRIGGDRVWSGSTNTYFTGTLDEAAVYPTALSEDAIRAHYAASGRSASNRNPVASFTTSADFLQVSVDGSASTDPDGPVASYAWNFGDGATATGPTATHTYAAGGTYTITLTVTDPQGATGTRSTPVSVGPNQAPVASFTATKDLLQVGFDASASTDVDGTVASYAWDFGDGHSDTGATTTHTYAAAGTYQVVLTVTDNRGATGTSSQSVTVVANQLPTAAFTSTVAYLSVGFDAAASADADGSVTGYSWTFGDGGTAAGVSPTHAYDVAGDYLVTLTVTDNRGGTASVTHQVTAVNPPNQLPTASFTASITDLSLSVDGTGSSDPDGNVALYAWDFGDGTTGSGATATHAYADAGAFTITLTVTDDDGGTATTTRSVTAVRPNQNPTAAFTSTVNGLQVTVDAGGSTDPDGTVASYAWTFGDGGTATGATASHTYADGGSFSVKLTVTDNRNGTDSVTKTVTVVAPGPLAKDDFGRTVTGGWGSADTGGAWSLTSGASKFSVSGGTGKVTLAAGQGYTASLPSVSSADTDLTVSVGIDQAATGGGQYVSAIGRLVSTGNDYRAKVRVLSTGVTVYLARTVGGTETVLSTTTVSGLTVSPGEVLQLRVQVTGNGTTTIRAKAWKGATEPTSWTSSTTDTTAALQGAGAVGLYTYLSGSTTNGPVVFSYDGLLVKSLAQ